ncbi:hypothetical protein GCM10027059_07100 [Myceligenerans halotolerans]
MEQNMPRDIAPAETDTVVELGDVVALTLGSKQKAGTEDKRYTYR